MEREAFTRLIEKYRGQMFFLARAKLGDEALAEDAVQDACEKMWRAVPRLRFESEEKARRYLVIAVTTAAIDLLRRRENAASVSFSDILAAPEKYGLLDKSPEEASAHKDAAGHILFLMERMGAKYYMALSLRAEGYSNTEIAEIMGVSVYDAGMVIHRGRKRLAAMLEQEEVNA